MDYNVNNINFIINNNHFNINYKDFFNLHHIINNFILINILQNIFLYYQLNNFLYIIYKYLIKHFTINKIQFFIYKFKTLYQLKYLNRIINIHMWLNHKINNFLKKMNSLCKYSILKNNFHCKKYNLSQFIISNYLSFLHIYFTIIKNYHHKLYIHLNHRLNNYLYSNSKYYSIK